MEQVPATGGGSADTLDDSSFTDHGFSATPRQEESSPEVLSDPPSHNLATPTAPRHESHPPVFFSPPPMTADPVVNFTEVASIPPAPQEVVQELVVKLSAIAQQNDLKFDVSRLSHFVKNSVIQLQTSGPILRVHDKAWSWNQHYTVLSFLLNGQLHADYVKLSGWLGLPPCGKSQWQRVIERLEPHVTQLAEWSCKHVRDTIEERGDKDKWVASFDGFYLTRGHYSNNSSATIHDYYGGGVAWFTHRTKTGPGHNWEGTSGGAEGDMLEEVLSKVNGADFVIKELVTDKDSTTNAIFCRHFPEGTVTYCSNHCTKNLHKQLEKLKKNKCEVYCAFEIFNVSFVFF